jgi:hypothetical protein
MPASRFLLTRHGGRDAVADRCRTRDRGRHLAGRRACILISAIVWRSAPSVSLPGQAAAHAVGATFILLWARRLGFDYGRLALRVSPSTVHHAEIVLDEDEHSRFAAQPVDAPTAEWLQAFQAECAVARQSLRWERGPAATELNQFTRTGSVA